MLYPAEHMHMATNCIAAFKGIQWGPGCRHK